MNNNKRIEKGTEEDENEEIKGNKEDQIKGRYKIRNKRRTKTKR